MKKLIILLTLLIVFTGCVGSNITSEDINKIVKDCKINYFYFN